MCLCIEIHFIPYTGMVYINYGFVNYSLFRFISLLCNYYEALKFIGIPILILICVCTPDAPLKIQFISTLLFLKFSGLPGAFFYPTNWMLAFNSVTRNNTSSS